MKNLELINLLKKSNNLYLKILQELENDYNSFNFKNSIIFSYSGLFLINFKKNFFTLLMISILIKSKLNEKQVISYGKIIFCLRSIVTSTDNIIDNENKNITKINDIPDIVTNNIFNLMIHQNIINNEIKSKNCSSIVFKELLEKLFYIAKSESLRNISLYKKYPSTDTIEKNIHEGIGGELLQLSLRIPLLLEENSFLKSYNEGLFHIGMALQALDDLTDIEEDDKTGKVNLATAFLYNSLNKEDSINNYLITALEKALYGFQIFEKIGYPIDRKTAIFLLKKLFKIRGVDFKYLKVFNLLK
ncbi:hypothetical protein FV113G1_P10520 (plasmid) [Fusobacterium varium]|nr:hypothetical protein FV113G1_P10520 [Fusobacterium varium]